MLDPAFLFVAYRLIHTALEDIGFKIHDISERIFGGTVLLL